ncbi:MAG: 50S ribosomal protein L13 [Candidatus Woesearchaeota archaeon]
MIINAENLILGRIASYAAKKLLLGEKIEIINCEKAVISGNKNVVLEKYKTKFLRGSPRKGPFFSRRPEAIMKRTIKGMLPHKQEKGVKALKNLKCYSGVPEHINQKNIANIKELEKFSIEKLPNTKFITLKELSKLLGNIEV